MERASPVTTERIVGVAILLPFREDVHDPRQTFVAAPAPARHHHILHQIWPIGAGPRSLDRGQGFVTDKGRYVDRNEGWKIAEAAGQIIARCGGDTTDGGTLYSENVW
jgi:hypothetical protein